MRSIRALHLVVITLVLAGFLVIIKQILPFLKIPMFQANNKNGQEYLIHVQSGHVIFVHANTSFIDLRDETKTILRMFVYLATENHELPSFKCILKRNGVSSSISGSGYIVSISSEYIIKSNRTAQFVCELPFDARYKQNKVRLISSSGEKGKVKKVGAKIKAGIKRTGFAICLNTLYNCSSPYEIAEWIEMQRLLGVTKVFIYGMYGIAPDVVRVLNHYIKIGVLEILYWNFTWRKSMWVNGLDTVLNHCLYSLMDKYEYIGVYDWDEFVIPGVKKNGDEFVKLYPDFMSRLKSKAGPSKSGYMFARKMFCSKVKNGKALEYKSLRVINTYSVIDHYQPQMKTIIKSEDVTVLAAHNPREYQPGKRGVYIHENIGIIHHYRQFTETCKAEDRSALVYADVIQKAVRDAFKRANVANARL